MMEHIFSLMVIGGVMAGMAALFAIGDLLIWLCGKLFPKMEGKLLDLLSR